MSIVIVLVALMLIALTVTLPVVIWLKRQAARERKNYERALKMIPLLIHLPPMSEDIEIGTRDVRDVVDENISKAQVIYNIIASTMQKGSRSKLYGQRHFGFEIVAEHGFVHFYGMVPVSLVDVVKQAVTSAYPAAQLEEVSEHNIFNPIGKLPAVTGGEFVLKKQFAYPIATYQETKRDSMQALLNALSTLDKEDGVAVQLLLRPTAQKWQQTANALASDKRKGKKSKSGIETAASFGKQFVVALAKPPSEADSKKDNKPELSSLEQSVLDAIDDKTRYQGYETLIRIVVSSNVSQRSQAILSNIASSFSLFDAPGKNGFKYVATSHPAELVADYLLRLFPQRKHEMILNAVELATIFHFPDQRSIPTSQLQRQESKQVDAPRNMPAEGLLLGYNLFRGAKKPIRLALQDRQRHMYVVGQTGTGKSTFLENLALQDMLNGNGFAFVDPHGDTVERLISMVPKERTEDVIYFCPADMDYPMGLNIFEYTRPDQKDFLIQECLNMLYKLYDPQHQGIMGPRYEHLFRNAALAVMADPEGGTFVDIPKLFRDPKFVQQKLKHVTDPNVREFWEKEMPQSQRSNEFGDVVSWFVSKFGAFLSNEMMRNIIGQTKSSFDLRDIMDNKKVLLVNLSKGRTGQLNMQLLGIIFVMKFQAAAMSRASMPESERKDFALYVDEFQNFSTDSFATILSEARKYHLNLIAANQFTTQLSEEIRDAVFGNVGTTIAFRVGDRDAEALRKYFRPSFDETDLLRVPNYNAVVRTMVGGVPTMPFSMATLPPLGSPNPRLGDALKQLSAAKYGRPKAAVEQEIFARMETKVESGKPAFGLDSGFGTSPSWASKPGYTPAFGAPAAPARSSMPLPAKQGSFLDEWLAKRDGEKPGARRHPSSAPSFGAASTLTPTATPAMPADVWPAEQGVAGSLPAEAYDNLGPKTALGTTPSPDVEQRPPSISHHADHGRKTTGSPAEPAETANTNVSGEFKFPRQPAAAQPQLGEEGNTIYIDADGRLRTTHDPDQGQSGHA